jgi:hypothetical protein
MRKTGIEESVNLAQLIEIMGKQTASSITTLFASTGWMMPGLYCDTQYCRMVRRIDALEKATMSD